VISVLQPGLLTTVQDQGRPGHRAFGMPVAGAADRWSFAVANLLAGNPPGAAALELTLLGGTFRFALGGYAALAGADMQATLDGAPVAPWSAFPVAAGAVLALGAARAGVRAYLAVRGGVDVPPVLGSRSTYTRARVGGLSGRALAKGDLVPVGGGDGPEPGPRRLPAELTPSHGGEVVLRAIPGPQEDRFHPHGLATLFSHPYRVTPQNDRMGFRLEGPPVRLLGAADIVTDALLPGAVQVPGNGQPIVMMVDCQTTGGYAKIATVIGPDLARLAQARSGESVRFARCTQEEAVEALRAEQRSLAAVEAQVLAR
jgi:biotin-dependent carboxylase-like uncharacterized protein